MGFPEAIVYACAFAEADSRSNLMLKARRKHHVAASNCKVELIGFDCPIDAASRVYERASWILACRIPC